MRRNYKRWVTVRWFLNDRPMGESVLILPVYRDRENYNRRYARLYGDPIFVSADDVAEVRMTRPGVHFHD